MSIKTIAVAAVAALGLSVGSYSASAGPVGDGAALLSAKAPSTFTLVRGGGGGHGGGFGGGGHVSGFGGGFGGGHPGGFAGGHVAGIGGHRGGYVGGPGFSGMRPGGMNFAGPGRTYGGQAFARSYSGGRATVYRPGIAGKQIYAGRGLNGRHFAYHHGRRGYWRHGHFYPFFGVGLWDYGYAGGSCYANCRAAGFGPGYCSVNAENFCY